MRLFRYSTSTPQQEVRCHCTSKLLFQETLEPQFSLLLVITNFQAMYHVGSVMSSFFKDHSWYHRRGSKSVLGLKARYKGPSGFHHRICTLKRLDIYAIRKSFSGDSDNLEIIRLLKELYIQRIIFGHEIVFHFPFISTACISCAGAIGILFSV